MFKRTFAIIIAFTLTLSLLPSVWIFASSETDALRLQLTEAIEDARPLLYRDNSEQTEKYLYDRLQRAEAAVLNRYSNSQELSSAANALSSAVELLAPMKDSERVSLMSFDQLTSDDLALMANSAGALSLDADNKPETARQAVVLSGSGEIVYDNSAGNDVVGASPFGIDMFDTDGLRLWVGVDVPATLSLTVGKRSRAENFSLTASNIPVEGKGYITIPYYFFSADTDGAEIETDGLMNYVRIECKGADTLRFADLHAYREAVDRSTRAAYSEERVMSRNALVNNAYYKIYSADSYGTSAQKAVTLGPLPNETTLAWENSIDIEADNMSFTLEDAVEGDLTQLWQFTPDPSGNSTFRIINKGSACAMKLSDSTAHLSYHELDYNDTGEEFSITITKGEAALQVRGVGKLTYTGSTVKGTTANVYKKFVLAKVNDGEYVQTWSDEFDGDELDRNIWRPDSGYVFGGTNTSLYVDSEETAYVEDGHLVMRTLETQRGGYESIAPHIKSTGKFAMSYGRLEIRAKMPKGLGMWPALWMMPVDSMNMARSEIDLMEMPVKEDEYKDQGDKLYGRQIATLHWCNPAGTTYMAKPIYMFSENYVALENDYHTYAVEIDTDQVRVYFDEALCMTLNLVNDGIKFAYGDVARYIILSSGGIEGLSNAVLNPELEYGDKELLVDYVRAYIRTEQATDDTPDFTTEESIIRSDAVRYLGRDYNSYMNSYPTAVSPDGTQAIMADQAGVLCVFDPRTNEVIDTVSTGQYKAYLTAAYSPDGSKFAAGTMNGSVVIYDTSDFSKAPVRIHNGATMHYCLTFTADGRYLIAGGFNGGAQSLKNPINNSVTQAHYIRVFDASDGSVVNELFVESDPLSACISPDGSKLAVTTTSAGVFIFDTSDWSEYAHFTTEHVNTINFCRFSSDGRILASSDEAGEVVLWDVETKAALRRLDTVNESSVRRFDISPDGKFVVTTSCDGAARVYATESGRCVSMLGGFGAMINDAAFSPDGRFVAAASYDHTVKLYYADGTYIATLLQPENLQSEGFIVSNLCFTPDSKYLLCANASAPTSVNRWELPRANDKSALKAAIDAYAEQDENLVTAEKVYAMKYASAEMIEEAAAALTGEAVPGCFGNVSVSSDGVTFSVSANVYKGGWIYVKADVTGSDGVSVVVSTAEGVLTERPLNEIKIAYDSATVTLRTYVEDSGEYFIKLVNERTGETSAPVTVSVSDVETTRDFGYAVSGGEVTITGPKTGEEYVYIPDYIDGFPVTRIADYAFSGYGQKVTHMKLRLPSTLKEIGAYAFYECSSLDKLELPDGLEKIASYAFGRCLSLLSVDIPDSVTSLSSNAFYYVRGPRYVRFGGGVKTVPSNVNYMGVSNRCFIFNEGVTSISSGVSSIAKLIERVYIPRSVTSINAIFINGMMAKVKLYGYPGTAAETFANNDSRFEFVPLAAPVISGVEEGETYDLFDGEVSASWDEGHVAYLNGEQYYAGHPITKAGEYTLEVINGYDEFTTEVHFTVTDTTPAKGDIDGDGIVTVSDALRALRLAAKLIECDEKSVYAADVDGDGEITVADALAILRASIGLIIL